ncbi:ArsR/SmtB family transcription factor [Methyloligella solikamskensis]|uniref:ArsR/SmtB family transcription factor n=1 Tax=Methyloligella solikamskensis TaxID=1177756 RepID=A0ABW3J650_9HYPH
MSSEGFDRKSVTEAAERLKIFAQPQRLMILACLIGAERHVGEIDEITGIGQPALSQKLAELRKAGLVTGQRIAKQVHYRLASESVALTVKRVMASVDGPAGPARITTTPRATPTDSKQAGAARFAKIG